MKSPNQYVGPAALQGVRIFVAVFVGGLVFVDRVIRWHESR